MNENPWKQNSKSRPDSDEPCFVKTFDQQFKVAKYEESARMWIDPETWEPIDVEIWTYVPEGHDEW